jgi:hypothetical protein
LVARSRRGRKANSPGVLSMKVVVAALARKVGCFSRFSTKARFV